MELSVKSCKNPIYVDEEGYNSWSDSAHHVDTLGPTKIQGHEIMF